MKRHFGYILWNNSSVAETRNHAAPKEGGILHLNFAVKLNHSSQWPECFYEKPQKVMINRLVTSFYKMVTEKTGVKRTQYEVTHPNLTYANKQYWFSINIEIEDSNIYMKLIKYFLKQ